MLDLPISTAFIDAQIGQRRTELTGQLASLEAELAIVGRERARVRAAASEIDQHQRALNERSRQVAAVERTLGERHHAVEVLVSRVDRHRQDLEGLLDAVSVFAEQAGTMLDLVRRRFEGVDRATSDLMPPRGG